MVNVNTTQRHHVTHINTLSSTWEKWMTICYISSKCKYTMKPSKDRIYVCYILQYLHNLTFPAHYTRLQTFPIWFTKLQRSVIYLTKNHSASHWMCLWNCFLESKSYSTWHTKSILPDTSMNLWYHWTGMTESGSSSRNLFRAVAIVQKSYPNKSAPITSAKKQISNYRSETLIYCNLTVLW